MFNFVHQIAFNTSQRQQYLGCKHSRLVLPVHKAVILLCNPVNALQTESVFPLLLRNQLVKFAPLGRIRSIRHSPLNTPMYTRIKRFSSSTFSQASMALSMRFPRIAHRCTSLTFSSPGTVAL